MHLFTPIWWFWSDPIATIVAKWFCSGKQSSLKDFFLGDRNIPWWAASFSGVATIVSGVSYLTAPGLAFSTNYTYHQIRLGIPLALMILCVVIVPILFRLNVFSIYEYLERRFDRRVRLLASGVFVVAKCFYLGVVVYAPSIVVAEITGFSLRSVVIATGIGTALYTVVGGMKAVIWTDTMQLAVLLLGLVAALAVLLGAIPGGLGEAWRMAEAAGKLDVVNVSFSLTETYTLWGGLIGGTFLLVSQWGSDQAEIQRFLTTRSIKQANGALISSMLASVGVGLALFFVGTCLFAFYSTFPEKGGLTVSSNRIFAKFIVEELPSGLAGLLVAGVLAASMSTISSVLNSLATVTSSDFLPYFAKRPPTVGLARMLTLGYGVFITILAGFGGQVGNLLEAALKVASLFGGSMAGVFLLGMLSRRATSQGAFYGMILGVAFVIWLSLDTKVSFLWFAPFSAIVTFTTGCLISLLGKDRGARVSPDLTFQSPVKAAEARARALEQAGNMGS